MISYIDTTELKNNYYIRLLDEKDNISYRINT